MKILRIIFPLCLMFMLLSIGINVFAEGTQESIKINNTTLTFNGIVYVDTNGSDTIGDGSADKPYASVDYAIGKAVAGNAVYIREGTYRLKPMRNSPGYAMVGIWDMNKKLTILGQNEKTIVEFYGADSTERDGGAVAISGGSRLMNLVYKFHPAKSANYSNALFIWCSGEIHNVFFNVIGTVTVKNTVIVGSYSYYNDRPVDTPKVYNCLFYHDTGKTSGDYSGSPLYQNCLTNAPFGRGKQVTCAIGTYTISTIESSKSDPNLVNKGTGTNPDGSKANIGVYGGEFAWGYTPTLDVTTAVYKAMVGDEITADIVIHNASNICAEDIKITYDTNLLEYVGAVAADGMKIYKEADLTNGTHRYITASLGKANAANGNKVLFKLKFKAKAPGQAKIDIVKGRVADNATLEADVSDENCGEKTITIVGTKDVNRTGEFTLLDLGIDAWYYGDPASATDSTKYDADVEPNGQIDDLDLTTIVNQIVNNPNYPANQ